MFLCRTAPDVQHLLSPLDEVIIHQFVPSLIGRPVPGLVLSLLFSLPTRLVGGLNIAPPSSHANEFNWSLMLCRPLDTSMLGASGSYSVQVIAAQEVEKRL